MADPVELVGYLASALIVISLMMSSVLKLRVVNLVGAVIFATYGVLIASLPVVLTNGAITVINVAHLSRLWRQRAGETYFEVVDVAPDSELLRRFVEFHADDIANFQPEFTGVRSDHLAWMVLHEAAPVGVVLASRTTEHEAHIELDYVTEAHRDFTPGAVLFGDSRAFESHGITRVTSTEGSAAHRRYLERMGFAHDGERWVREVP